MEDLEFSDNLSVARSPPRDTMSPSKRRLMHFQSEEDDDEDNDQTSGRKRFRPMSEDEKLSRYLSDSMKKVKLCKQSPGQLRLTGDLNQLRANDMSSSYRIVSIIVDPIDPHRSRIGIAPNRNFEIVVNKHYPHVAPTLVDMATNQRVFTPIMHSWLPIYSLANVLEQLFDPHQHQL